MLPASPKAKKTYRNAQAAMPMASVIFTPSRISRNGKSSRNSTSEHLPKRLHRRRGPHALLVEEEVGEVVVEGQRDADRDRGEEEHQVGTVLQQPDRIEPEDVADG